MCLAIPGKVVDVASEEPLFASAIVEFGGVRRRVNMACVPEAKPGDYVMVHAGLAISRVDEQEAVRTLETLEQLALSEEPDGSAAGRASGASSLFQEPFTP